MTDGAHLDGDRVSAGTADLLVRINTTKLHIHGGLTHLKVSQFEDRRQLLPKAASLCECPFF